MRNGQGENSNSTDALNVSFEYQCNSDQHGLSTNTSFFDNIENHGSVMRKRSGSFSCLSGAAVSANFTLANTNICNGLLGEEILPILDSPKSFKRMASSPSLSRLDPLPCSSQYSKSSLGGSTSGDSYMLDGIRNLWKPKSAPTRVEYSSFLNVQMAGGAAGEDRVQAVCSEENGWVFCGIYDGFNGRDAADFLATTLYENIMFYLHMLESQCKRDRDASQGESTDCPMKNAARKSGLSFAFSTSDTEIEPSSPAHVLGVESSESFSIGVLNCIALALSQAENDFMYMVEQEMQERPDLVSIGSCVLTVLLHGRNLYILNLGDSRAVLATIETQQNGSLGARQLTECHTVDDKAEYDKVLADHPDDSSVVINGKVKGKLKVTRAIGAGYLKRSKMNDALMGILRVQDLQSPPYVYSQPSTISHRILDTDLFVILGSDGLFDFFSNDEVVGLVHKFIKDNSHGDPAKYLIEQVLLRAAKKAGFSMEELMEIPAGRRRRYHDDVTVIVIILGNKQRTSAASMETFY